MLLVETSNRVSDIAALVSSGCAFLAVIISLIIYINSSISSKRDIVFSHFEEMYNECFSLRDKINRILGIDWYYEIDSLVQNEAAYEEALNYVNKFCNIFTSFIYHKNSKRLWLKLMPIKLFNRLVAMYPFIIYCRKVNNDDSKFKAYEDMLLCCSKSKSIRKRYFQNKQVIWVGIRESDCKFSKATVIDHISIFGKASQGKRPNHNLEDFNTFYSHEIEKKIKKNPKCRFILYNSNLAYILDKNKRKHIQCVNKEDILLILNDKIKTRARFSALNINCIPSVTVESNSLNFDKLCALFNTEKLVIQATHGGGGYATYVVHQKNYKNLFASLSSRFTQYLVSPYFEKNISVNLHIVVCEKQNVIFPASVQIIENINDRLLYRGADFISFREIDNNMKKRIQQMGASISNILRRMGYMGIAGIDMMIANGELYFVEINPRFQASSFIIDKYLTDRYEERNKQKFKGLNIIAKNLTEVNINSFKDIANIDVSFFDEINYSCYFYFKDGYNRNVINLKLALLEKAGIEIDRDGYNEDSTELNNDSYLFRALFTEKITQISPDGDLWILDNVKFNSVSNDKLELKIALLNQGVRLNIKKNNIKIKEAVFDAVDLYIKSSKIYVNSPLKSKLIKLSPFEIVDDGSCRALLFNGEKVSEVEIEYDKIEITSSTPERGALYLSTDRLRITPALGCQYKSHGLGCRFCNLPPCKTIFSVEQLKKAYDYGKTLLPRHVMIGGGTILNSNSLNLIKNLASYIKTQNKDIEITLMSVPQNISDLPDLKENGITDVSFNIEIFNENSARSYMPGKSQFSRKYYLDVLEKAVKVWSEYGDVRSLIIVGLESTKSLIEEIIKLNKIGVQPVLSVFRPMENSPLENMLPPSNKYLLSVYKKISVLLGSERCLGPKCDKCKNNTLSL